MGEEAQTINLPIIDLAAPDRRSTAASIRQACIESGFFYIVNHGIEKELLDGLFEESRKFFLLPLEDKMKLSRKMYREYAAMYAEKLDATSTAKGGLGCSSEEVLGAFAHSDYGMLTLLATDGVPGLQVCREKDHHPRVWEDVRHLEGAFIVNIGDLLERWTNGVFRSTLHRVNAKGKERFSAAFFCDPPADVVVECLESCCSESNPPRFPPIRAGDYYQERFRLTYGA